MLVSQNSQQPLASASSQVIAVAEFFDGEQWHQQVQVELQAGRIQVIQPAASEVVLAGRLVPGFIDIQVNGGGGVLFNSEPTVGALKTMVKAHAQFGSTGLMPTVITDSISVMQQAADAVAAAIAQGELGILGIHFEGPHLSVPKRGVHPTSHIREISAAEMAVYARTDIGLKMVTLAPEQVSPAQIQQLVGLGVKVCLGHSNADGATVRAALDAGASGFTHLYNAMSPLTSREPGMVGVALTDAASWCGIILDGHHVDVTAAKLAMLAKPQGKMILVTDAMSPVGTQQTEFPFFSGKVSREGSKLTNEHGSLAGSVLDMAAAVRYAVEQLALPLAEAVRMASLYPAQFLAIDTNQGKLLPNYQADMVLLDSQGAAMATWIQGQLVWQQPASANSMSIKQQ